MSRTRGGRRLSGALACDLMKLAFGPGSWVACLSALPGRCLPEEVHQRRPIASDWLATRGATVPSLT
jgi:hypothetical protein